jgi:hypothetical protein
MIFARASPPQIFAPGLQKGSILIGKNMEKRETPIGNGDCMLTKT